MLPSLHSFMMKEQEGKPSETDSFQNAQLAMFVNFCMAFYLRLMCPTSYNPGGLFANIVAPRRGCWPHSWTNELYEFST